MHDLRDIQSAVDRQDTELLISSFNLDEDGLSQLRRSWPGNKLAVRWKRPVGMLVFGEGDHQGSEYEQKRRLAAALTVTLNDEGRWAMPLLQDQCDKLYKLAGHDEARLTDLADLMRQVVRLTVTDRNEDPYTNRNWGRYAAVTLLFRIYYRLHAYSMLDTVVKGLVGQNVDGPPIEKLPAPQEVAYLFYVGITDFAAQRYARAIEQLERALDVAVRYGAPANIQEALLRYIVPAKLVVGHKLPSEKLWGRFDGLRELYKPVVDNMKKGNYRAFNESLLERRKLLVSNRIYLALDALSVKCLLHLVLRVWKFEQRPRRLSIPLIEAALAAVGHPHTRIDAELLLARLISAGDIKGRIEHDMGLLLLSATQPFPTLVRPVPPATEIPA